MFSNTVQLLSNSLYLSIIQPGNPETRKPGNILVAITFFLSLNILFPSII